MINKMNMINLIYVAKKRESNLSETNPFAHVLRVWPIKIPILSNNECETGNYVQVQPPEHIFKRVKGVAVLFMASFWRNFSPIRKLLAVKYRRQHITQAKKER